MGREGTHYILVWTKGTDVCIELDGKKTISGIFRGLMSMILPNIKYGFSRFKCDFITGLWGLGAGLSSIGPF